MLVIVGPNASGKSALAVQLAKKLNGEIVSADSRQVYRGLDIGSGKITKNEMKGVPHHLLDVADPKKKFTVVDFKRLAEKKIEEISKKGKLPILCGGSGFYIQAVIDDFQFPTVPPNKILREKLEKKSTDELFFILSKKDYKRASEIDKKNPTRLIRAIEIATAMGMVPPIKKQQEKYDLCIIGLCPPREELYKKIHKRLMARIRHGLIEEVKTLRANGVPWKRLEELGLEYRYTAKYLLGEFSKEEFVSKLEQEIKKYAKRQLTWFRRDKRIHWVKNSKEAFDYLKQLQYH